MEKLSFLPVLRTKQVFSLNKDSIGVWKSLGVTEVVMDTKVSFWQKVARGFYKVKQFFKKLFSFKKKNKRKKRQQPNLENYKAALLKKECFEFSIYRFNGSGKKEEREAD